MKKLTNPISELTNVFEDGATQIPFRQLLDRDYLTAILQNLRKEMGAQFFAIDFYIFSTQQFVTNQLPVSAFLTTDKPKVLLFFGEEYASIPIPLTRHYLAIFKCYLPHDKREDNLYPLPLPHHTDYYEGEIKYWEDRSTNVFFSGQMTPARYMGLYRGISPLRFVPSTFQLRLPTKATKWMGQNCSRHFPNSLIHFTSEYRTGFSKEEYRNHFQNSKIALCPKGQFTAETTRHFEAAASGCIVISEKLPDTHLYRNAPFIQLNNWRREVSIIHELLKNPTHQLTLHHQVINWYKTNYHPYAVGKYMAKKIVRQFYRQNIVKKTSDNPQS